MRAKKKEKSKSLNLALYFGFFVFLIIAVSLLFKVFDEFRKSKFDGKNRFTVAVIHKDTIDVVSVSPEEKSLTRLRIEEATSLSTLRNLSIPIDSYIKPKATFPRPLKVYFVEMLINKRNLETDLNAFDLLKLSLHSLIVPEEKIKEEVSSLEKREELSSLSSSLFIDEAISSEKVSIQITNATEVLGLGNKIAKYITNMGGNVVLVNSSKEVESKSKIIYKEDSYTVEKISQILGVPLEKKEVSSISDIIIIVGKDKEGF